MAPAPGGFPRINLLSSGIQEPVPGDDGIPPAMDFRFSNMKVNCGTLVDVVSISPEKPVNGFSLVNASGTCSKGIALANIVGAELRGIRVTARTGLFVTTTNVQDTGLAEPK